MGEPEIHDAAAERAASLPRRPKGDTARVTTLDPVKIDLAVALLLLPVLWLVLSKLTVAPGLQLTILASAAGIASGWIIWRTRRLLRRADTEHEKNCHSN